MPTCEIFINEDGYKDNDPDTKTFFNAMEAVYKDHQILFYMSQPNRREFKNLVMYRPDMQIEDYYFMEPRDVWYGMFQGILHNRVGMTFMRTVLEMSQI